MSLKHDDDEQLEDYAVDVRKLRGIHEHLVAKRSEIEALFAEEQKLGGSETMDVSTEEGLKSQVEALLEQWEKEKNEHGQIATGSERLRKLALEHFELEQQILDAQDEQVKEATEHPFDHRLR